MNNIQPINIEALINETLLDHILTDTPADTPEDIITDLENIYPSLRQTYTDYVSKCNGNNKYETAYLNNIGRC